MAALGTKIVLFGGRQGTASNIDFGDTWEWDGENWTQRFPATSPSPRAEHAMATRNDKVVLFGGDNGSGETWEWDGENWTQKTPVNSPPAGTRLVAASLGDEVLLVEGRMGTTPVSLDVWEWDGVDWTQRNSPSEFVPSPSPGCLSAWGEGVILLGLEGTGTWEYSAVRLQGSGCADASECLSPYCVDGVCCDAPCSGQCEACDVAGSVGVCTQVAGAPVGARPACDSGAMCQAGECMTPLNTHGPSGCECGAVAAVPILELVGLVIGGLAVRRRRKR